MPLQLAAYRLHNLVCLGAQNPGHNFLLPTLVVYSDELLDSLTTAFVWSKPYIIAHTELNVMTFYHDYKRSKFIYYIEIKQYGSYRNFLKKHVNYSKDNIVQIHP